MINYGSGGIGSEIIANRLHTGPMHDCTDCAYEEFFLSSQTVGDPGMLVNFPANTGIEQCDPTAIAGPSCWRDPINLANGPIPGNFALFQEDPDTEAIVMIGEIGGSAEEEAAEYIQAHVKKPVVGEDGELSVATVMSVTLSVDHRVIDGALGVATVMSATGSFDHRAIDGADGALAGTDFPDGRVEDYQYDEAGRVARVVRGGGGHAADGCGRGRGWLVI